MSQDHTGLQLRNIGSSACTGERAALFLPTGTGGYGECSLVTTQPTLSVGYLQPGVQPGGGARG